MDAFLITLKADLTEPLLFDIHASYLGYNYGLEWDTPVCGTQPKKPNQP